MASDRCKMLEPMAKSSLLLADQNWRRACGCIKTSEKLKHILMSFPSAPPPTPMPFKLPLINQHLPATCISSCCKHDQQPDKFEAVVDKFEECTIEKPRVYYSTRTREDRWKMVQNMASLIQLSVTATALALYYLIYCYMQLVYYTLKSALYFHHADGPMKVTIGVMTLTSLVVGFNLLIRIERLIGLGMLS